jgi:hypothetical protein
VRCWCHPYFIALCVLKLGAHVQPLHHLQMAPKRRPSAKAIANASHYKPKAKRKARASHVSQVPRVPSLEEQPAGNGDDDDDDDGPPPLSVQSNPDSDADSSSTTSTTTVGLSSSKSSKPSSTTKHTPADSDREDAADASDDEATTFSTDLNLMLHITALACVQYWLGVADIHASC